MTRAYFSSLPLLKQKLWANFRDYEGALVTTEQENNVSEKTHVSLRIVEIYSFVTFFFFHFHVVTVVLLYIIGSYNYYFGLARSKCLWKHQVYGLLQSFNFIVNARTESCLQDVELGHEETVT